MLRFHFLFFFNDTATTEIYTLSLHDALPISRRFLGVVGLESIAHLHQSAELGYWLRADASRRGYMTEAARATVSWAFKRLNAHRIRVAAATDNVASLGVIRRVGFRYEGVAR